MLTIQRPDDHAAIERIGRMLRDGAIVGLPTETVYGLAAKVDIRVLERLDQIKGRDPNKRYTLHIGSVEDISRYVPHPSLLARKLMRPYWPGPLTIVFDIDSDQLEQIRKGLPPEAVDLLYADGTLGVRFPDNPVSCAILSSAVAPIIAPSANPHAQSPALTANAVSAYFDGQLEAIIDTPDACKYRLNSTVVKAGRYRVDVLREGVFSREQIRQSATIHILFICTGNTCRSPMAEVLCRKYFADKLNCGLDEVGALGYSIASAGVAAFDGMPASSHAQGIARQLQTPLDHHRSRHLTKAMIQRADVIFGMTAGHLQTAIEVSPEAAEKCRLLDDTGNVPDPAGCDRATYRACAEQINRSIQERMNELL